MWGSGCGGQGVGVGVKGLGCRGQGVGDRWWNVTSTKGK